MKKHKESGKQLLLRVRCFPGGRRPLHLSLAQVRAAHKYNVYKKYLEQKVQVTIQIEQNLVKHFSFKQKFLLFLFINNNNNNNNNNINIYPKQFLHDQELK